MSEPSAPSGCEGVESLYVVIPVYNEAVTIGAVVREWASSLDALGVDYQLLVLNDGSKDDTGSTLAALAGELPRLEIVTKPNSGHGQTCVEGYRLAIARGATWVFQIDGDGQCDPRYFRDLWARRADHPAVFGRRVSRDDGVHRAVISWCCRVATRAISGVGVHDPNVPYRLVRADVLERAIEEFPRSFGLANILVAVVVQEGLGDRLGVVDIGFRERRGGQPSVRWLKFASEGLRLCRALAASRPFIRARARAVAKTSESASLFSGTAS